jgi:hypothetical protein
MGGNESATMCGDDRLADCKADANAFSFVVKDASKILLGSENTYPRILYIDHDLLL